MNDNVNHPQHYTDGGLETRRLECIDVTRLLPFDLGNAVKYVWRAGKKGDLAKAMEDLDKAEWYLDDWECTAARNPKALWGYWEGLRLGARVLVRLSEGVFQASALDEARREAVCSIVEGDLDSAYEAIRDLRRFLQCSN